MAGAFQNDTFQNDAFQVPIPVGLNLRGELEGFYTSPDGSTWASKTSPWESAKDYIQLYCGNETGTDDLWAAFWDTSADEICRLALEDKTHTILSLENKQLLRQYLDNQGIVLTSVKQLPDNIKKEIVKRANIQSAAERERQWEESI